MLANDSLVSAKRFDSAQIVIPKEYIEFGDFRERSGQIAAERLLSLPTPPSAVFVANNEMMAGALFAIRERGIKVPRDLSLIGFDDARWAQYSDPPLTVVSQPTEAMGQKAAELLLGRLRGERPPIRWCSNRSWSFGARLQRRNDLLFNLSRLLAS